MKNNDGAGATQTRGSWNAKAIERPKGYNATCSAMDSKTRSRYRASSMHYQWADYGKHWGGNENVKGYGNPGKHY